MAKISVILPDEMAEQVDKEAERLMVNRSVIVRWALEKYNKSENKEGVNNT